MVPQETITDGTGARRDEPFQDIRDMWETSGVGMNLPVRGTKLSVSLTGGEIRADCTGDAPARRADKRIGSDPLVNHPNKGTPLDPVRYGKLLI